MPTYRYRAITEQGLVLTNKVESASKQSLLRAIKNNGLMPITIEQVAYSSRTQRKKKKNITNIEEIMKNANTAEISTKKESTVKEKVNMYLSKTEKITTRDVIIFTQNFYLLKKADFNNIHALRTIIDSTENYTFRGILEDILAGVEAGENMYTTMEYYSDIFPFIYINMIKVGELSGSLTKSLEEAVTYLESSTKLNRKIKGILIPNLVQFIVIFILLIVGTLVTIPAIQGVYDSFGSTEQLPKITIWFQGVLNGFIKYWYIPTFILVAIIARNIILYKHTKRKIQFSLF